MLTRLFSSLLLPVFLVVTLSAQNEKPPSPADLCAQMKHGLSKAKVGCVALSTGTTVASAVVISPDGLVITAAHVASRIKKGKTSKIRYEDGTVAEVEVLGWNIETDIALFQITSLSEKPWPHVEVAKASPLTGAFCFTYAHPSGKLKGRPAQVRIGRIVSHSVKRDKTCLLTADCNIQPGDSGGGLFSLDGKLIGIDSTAANVIGFNLFPAIDQYHLDRKRLLKKERWGDRQNSPENAENLKLKITKDVIAKVQAEMMRRFKLNYAPVVDFILERQKPDGTVELNQQEMINLMTRDAITLALGQPVSLGLDDPALSEQLKPLPKNHTQALAIYDGKKKLSYGLALNKQHLITKASLLEGHKNLVVRLGEKTIVVTVMAVDKKWDVAIVQLKNQLPLPAIVWPKQPIDIKAGDLLIAPDKKGRPLWGNATDSRRSVSKKRSIGPINKNLTSKHRAPYPHAIRNSLPLFAADAGTPVFDKTGSFVGMHIARFSRTMALIIPAEKLREVAKALLDKEPAEAK